MMCLIGNIDLRFADLVVLSSMLSIHSRSRCHILRVRAALCACAALTAVSFTAPAAAQTISHQLVASGLLKPMQLAPTPGDSSRLCVVEQRGQIRLIKNGVLQATSFLNIDALVPDQTYGGMFGLAFHPNYAKNGKFYVHHTTGATSAITIWVAEYTRGASSDVIDSTTRRVIFSVTSPSSQAFHLGGSLCFGADGLLYIPLGDGGYTGDAGGPPRSQSITGATSMFGKVLRIDVNSDDFPTDANKNYHIPAGNPFIGVTGEDEIFVRGMRNPFRCSFDSATGILWMGDVGGTAREEIDTLDPATDAAANFGWNCAEGLLCTTNTNCNCLTSGLRQPVYDYTHTVGLSITGGTVYRGCAMPAFEGHYFFADYQNNKIFSGEVTPTNKLINVVERTTQFSGGQSTITSICADLSGELYVTNHSTGFVRKIVQSPAPPDTNGNGIPDNCEPPANPFDIDGDGLVGATDLAIVLGAWGETGKLPADVDGSGTVDAGDLAAILGNWS